jgi:hypothetical protein
VLALVVGCAVAAAACGNGSGTGSPAATASGRQAEITAYLACLQRNGVTVVVPSGRPGGPGSGRPTAPPSGSAVVIPDGGVPTEPPPDGGGGGDTGPGGFGPGGGGGFLRKPADVDQETWDKAQNACSSLRPSFGSSGFPRGDNGADAAYRNCLRDHGASAGATPGPDAVKACEVLRPAPPSSS